MNELIEDQILPGIKSDLFNFDVVSFGIKEKMNFLKVM